MTKQDGSRLVAVAFANVDVPPGSRPRRIAELESGAFVLLERRSTPSVGEAEWRAVSHAMDLPAVVRYAERVLAGEALAIAEPLGLIDLAVAFSGLIGRLGPIGHLAAASAAAEARAATPAASPDAAAHDAQAKSARPAPTADGQGRLI